MKGYPGVSPFIVKYVTRGKCKTRDGHGKWLERRSAGGATVHYTYFKARFMKRGKVIHLGNFNTADEAAAAVRRAKRDV